MTVTVNITGLDPITEALNQLARALGAKGVEASVNTRNSTQQSHPETSAPTSAPITPPASTDTSPVIPPLTQQAVPTPAYTAPITEPVRSAPAVPPMQQTSVQTTASHYTPYDLAKAAAALMDSGRQNDLLNLLSQFSVESLPGLAQEQYGAFATALRGLGAPI